MLGDFDEEYFKLTGKDNRNAGFTIFDPGNFSMNFESLNNVFNNTGSTMGFTNPGDISDFNPNEGLPMILGSENEDK